MAQYYWTPDPADLGGPPAGWTNRFGTNVLVVRQDASSNYYLEISKTSNAVSVSTLDTIDGTDVSNIGDCQMFARFVAQDPSTARDYRQIVKFSGTSLATSLGRAGGYVANLSNVYLTALDGSETSEASTFVSDFTSGTTIGQRIQTIGNDHKAKTWDEALAEPGWTEEITSTLGVQASGRIGFYGFFFSNIRIYAVGLGTNGDAAPTAPVGGGTVTGTASHQAQTSTHSATGERSITGTASHTATTATHSATGSVGNTVTGIGSHQAEPATGTGTGQREVTATGSHSAQAATHSATGTREVAGAGSHQAATATHSGSGLRLVTGTGSHAAERTTHSGLGTVGNVTLGTGSHQAAPASHSAAGIREITGDSSAQAQAATHNAAAVREIIGSGTHSANDATHSATDSSTITGTASHQASAATHAASGRPVALRPYNIQRAVDARIDLSATLPTKYSITRN